MPRIRELTRWLGLLALLPGLAMAELRCERLVITGSPDAPPYLWRDPTDPKRLMGANADLLRDALTSLGMKADFEFVGRRSQALDEVRSGRMDLLADSPLNPAELENLDYIHPPISQNEILIWVRRDSDLAPASLADLHGRTGGISERTRLTPAFAETVASALKLQKAPTLNQAFDLLVAGKVDYLLAGRYAAQAVVGARGLGQAVEMQPLVVDRPGLYLALSFNSACNDPWLRGQLSKKMTELAASGAAAQAIQRNLALWMEQLRQAPARQEPRS